MGITIPRYQQSTLRLSEAKQLYHILPSYTWEVGSCGRVFSGLLAPLLSRPDRRCFLSRLNFVSSPPLWQELDSSRPYPSTSPLPLCILVVLAMCFEHLSCFGFPSLAGLHITLSPEWQLSSFPGGLIRTTNPVIPSLLQILPIFLEEPDPVCIALEASSGRLSLLKDLETFSRAITTLGTPPAALVLRISHDRSLSNTIR